MTRKHTCCSPGAPDVRKAVVQDGVVVTRVQVDPWSRERSTRNPVSLFELSIQPTMTALPVIGVAEVPRGAAGGSAVEAQAVLENAEYVRFFPWAVRARILTQYCCSAEIPEK